MELDRITIENNEKFLRQISSDVDFNTDNYMEWIEAYYDVNGNKIHEVFEGFKATVFSHEYDHLNGILHIDLSNDVREMTLEETKIYREQHPYEILSKDDKFDFESRKIRHFSI